jgi:cytochrome bd-type quinol oxidase subunit 2
MEPVWFVLVAVMIIAYVVLDGFDLGAGLSLREHLLVSCIQIREDFNRNPGIPYE